MGKLGGSVDKWLRARKNHAAVFNLSERVTPVSILNS
jgi:hypothetical protein